MAWLKLNWRWSALNLLAVFVLIYVLSQGNSDWSRIDTFDSGLESGKWAIRSLLACLTMTPLNTYFGWKAAIKLRKPAGLWAFGFATIHVLLYIRESSLKWLTISMPFYLVLGLAGMSILSLLASTSNRWAMQRLGRNWKRLHRLVYMAGCAVVTHSVLAANMSKKIIVRDPQAPSELKVYIAILCVLLVVRIPLIRNLLKQIPGLLKRPRKQAESVVPGNADLWPKIHGRESSVSLSPTFIIPHGAPNLAEHGLSERDADGLTVPSSPEEEARIR